MPTLSHHATAVASRLGRLARRSRSRLSLASARRAQARAHVQAWVWFAHGDRKLARAALAAFLTPTHPTTIDWET